MIWALDVTAQEIALLNENQLVELLRLLLHAEVGQVGLLRSAVHVPAQIRASDGGLDGTWFDANWEEEGRLARTKFLPHHHLGFQVKATEMRPSECAKEVLGRNGALKPRVAELLRAKGCYIVFCKEGYTKIGEQERAIYSEVSKYR